MVPGRAWQRDAQACCGLKYLRRSQAAQRDACNAEPGRRTADPDQPPRSLPDYYPGVSLCANQRARRANNTLLPPFKPLLYNRSSNTLTFYRRQQLLSSLLWRPHAVVAALMLATYLPADKTCRQPSMFYLYLHELGRRRW